MAIQAVFLEISKEKIKSIGFLIETGNFFLKYSSVIIKITIFAAMSGKAQVPMVNGLISKMSIPNSLSSEIVELFDAIRTGNTTETKLIRIMDIEKMRTAHSRKYDFSSIS